MKKRKTLEKYLITLTPRGVWVYDWLFNYTDAKDDSEVLRNALRIHLALFGAYDDRTILFSQKGGSKPFPVHLLAPSKMVELPPEANQGQSRCLKITLHGGARLLIKEFKRHMKVEDLSVAIENALFLHYDLLRRYLQAETFFLRDGKKSRFERVEIFSNAE